MLRRRNLEVLVAAADKFDFEAEALDELVTANRILATQGIVDSFGHVSIRHPDNPERFAALSWAAAQIARDGLADGWRPQVLHAHDWQAGLAPAYLRYSPPGDVGTAISTQSEMQRRDLLDVVIAAGKRHPVGSHVSVDWILR